MDSPVSLRALGECNAIKSRGFGHSELTSVGIFQTGFGTSRKPVSGSLPVGGPHGSEGVKSWCNAALAGQTSGNSSRPSLR
jgi:hypothetical protein